MSEQQPHRPYRLGLDVGSNSLGWFVVWLDDVNKATGLGPGGVRVFPDGRDPKSKTSNAVTRRAARSARRRRDRYVQRRQRLMDLLIEHCLMPEDVAERKALEGVDPYGLRAAALDTALPVHHVGRALFHLNQRRGFRSNRKTEKGDSETGAIKEAAGRLSVRMLETGARTLGEFLNSRHRAREGVRARNRNTAPGKADYEFYPTRQLLLDEFEAIWTAQSAHHPGMMTDEAKAKIHRAIFYQRPLMQPPVGKCTLDPALDGADIKGFRCPWSHPLAQRFRIWQEVRNLTVAETGQPSRALHNDEADKITLALLQKGKVGFDSIRTRLRLPPEARFNLESEKRRHLDGDKTAERLSHKNFLGKAWRSLQLDRQIEVIDRLTNEEDEDAAVAWLVQHVGLDAAAAARAASAILPDGHCRLGLRAIEAILPHMAAGLNYPDAAQAAGYDHALLPTGELSPSGRLPYYGITANG